MKNGHTDEELRWRKSAMRPQTLHRRLKSQYVWLAAYAACGICAAATARWDRAVIIALNAAAPALCIYSTRRMIADAEKENTDI